MEKLGCSQTTSLLKKGKKKHAKDEIDRQKQAEKKRRRLEKALATSAAIRSELEKKKQKKEEEQQRIDEEGAAIAEAVALNVLVGEDIDESHHFMLNNNGRYTPMDSSGNIGLFMGYQSFGMGYPTGRYRPGLEYNEWETGRSLPSRVHVRDLQSHFYEENYRRADISAELIAAQAVASLQIAEDSQEDPFFINRMLGENNMGDGVGFYKEF